jgi:hypothetical protein
VDDDTPRIAEGSRRQRTPDVATLRGAPVQVNARRAAVVASVVVLTALLGASVALFVSGARKNSQVNDLRDHGIAVEVTVTSCRGLLGGSGSNPVGYTCQGTYVVGDRRYRQTLPTDALYAAGAHVTLVAASDDPALLSTRALVAARRASWRVFLVPSVLLIVFLGALGWLVVRRRPPDGAALPS